MPGSAVILRRVVDERNHRSEYRLAVCQTPEVALSCIMAYKMGCFFDVEARKKIKARMFSFATRRPGAIKNETQFFLTNLHSQPVSIGPHSSWR
jgi:hypothetical protein